LPILQRLVETYKLWHQYLPNLPKAARYSLGEKIDGLFIQTVEAIVTATYLGREEKQPYILRAITKLDILKFFLKVAWEMKALDNKKYLAISEQLNEIGRMLGGWNKQLQTSAQPTRR
jgi:hypothetical protein